MSSMFDSDSFVILGTSPQSSLSAEVSTKLETEISPTENSPKRTTPIKVDKCLSGSNDQNQDQKSVLLATAVASSSQAPPKSNAGSTVGSGETSLAASFILGEIDADVLKASASNVSSELPGMCSMELQSFKSDYIELKNTLDRTNLTLQQFYKKTQEWKDDMKRVEQEYKKELRMCQTQMAAMRSQNLKLARDLNDKIDKLKSMNELRQRKPNENFIFRKQHDHIDELMKLKSCIKNLMKRTSALIKNSNIMLGGLVLFFLMFFFSIRIYFQAKDLQKQLSEPWYQNVLKKFT